MSKFSIAMARPEILLIVSRCRVQFEEVDHCRADVDGEYLVYQGRNAQRASWPDPHPRSIACMSDEGAASVITRSITCMSPGLLAGVVIP